jgi:hypothetical protein
MVIAFLFVGAVVGSCSSLIAKEHSDPHTALMEFTFKLTGRSAAPGRDVCGTGFVITQVKERTNIVKRSVLVTAAHILEDIQSDSAKLHLRKETNDSYSLVPTAVVIREKGKPKWVGHDSADVAVMEVQLPKYTGLSPITDQNLADDEFLENAWIHPGDNLFCLGYPFCVGHGPAEFPILRSGTIASYPLLPTGQVKTFWYDFEIFRGNSGGPVYFAEVSRKYKGGRKIGELTWRVMGLVSQEFLWDVTLDTPYERTTTRTPLKLAKVVHATFITETMRKLDQEPARD